MPEYKYAAETRADEKSTNNRNEGSTSNHRHDIEEQAAKIRKRCEGMPDVVKWSQGRRREWM